MKQHKFPCQGYNNSIATLPRPCFISTWKNISAHSLFLRRHFENSIKLKWLFDLIFSRSRRFEIKRSRTQHFLVSLTSSKNPVCCCETDLLFALIPFGSKSFTFIASKLNSQFLVIPEHQHTHPKSVQGVSSVFHPWTSQWTFQYDLTRPHGVILHQLRFW